MRNTVSALNKPLFLRYSLSHSLSLYISLSSTTTCNFHFQLLFDHKEPDSRPTTISRVQTSRPSERRTDGLVDGLHDCQRLKSCFAVRRSQLSLRGTPETNTSNVIMALGLLTR